MAGQVAVSVEGASKHFRLRHTHSLKEGLVWAVQGRPRHEDFHALAPLERLLKCAVQPLLCVRRGMQWLDCSLSAVAACIPPATAHKALDPMLSLLR